MLISRIRNGEGDFGSKIETNIEKFPKHYFVREKSYFYIWYLYEYAKKV